MISKVKDASAQSIHPYHKGESNKSDPGKQTGASSAITETVDLSSQAKDIRQIKQILSQIPDVREDKISELRAQIDSGNYTVQSDKIADKIAGESLIDIIV